jgi:succinyl-CoA:acetate CoA-transferase
MEHPFDRIGEPLHCDLSKVIAVVPTQQRDRLAGFTAPDADSSALPSTSSTSCSTR